MLAVPGIPAGLPERPAGAVKAPPPDQQRQLVSDLPDQPAYRFNLAEILLKSGDKAGAKQELEGLAKLGPKLPQQAQVQEMLKSL